MRITSGSLKLGEFGAEDGEHGLAEQSDGDERGKGNKERKGERLRNASRIAPGCFTRPRIGEVGRHHLMAQRCTAKASNAARA